MAAFSYQHHPSLLDSIFLPNSPIKMSLMADMNASCFSYYPSNAFPLHQSCSPENSTSLSLAENRLDSLSSVELKADSSSVVVELENSDYLPKQGSAVSRKRKSRNPNCPNSAQSKDSNQGRGRKVKKCSISSKAKADKKGLEEPPSGYIHVRARRGQATDSHSLAERVRREKISKRMKLLQSLVPGCDTVNSKALMLDEIINYVQSLQNQVEFLSMKLASVNPVFYDPASEDVEEYAAQTQKLWSSSFQLPNSTHETAFEGSTSNTFHATTNNHPLLESTPTTILFHGQRSSNAYSQDNANLLWEAEEKRQRFINPAGYTNLCSFH